MLKKFGLIFMAMVMCVVLSFGQSIAMTIVPGGIGDELNGLYDVRALIDPVTLETERENWQNFITIENTSGNWTAVHLRFREHKCSVEVWDRVILLSPHDVFWVALKQNATKDGVELWSTDSDTLLNSAMIFAPLGAGEEWRDTFKTALVDEIGSDTNRDISYGHFEVIGLFQLSMIPGFTEPEDVHDLSLVVQDLYPTALTPDGFINIMDVLRAAYYDFDDAGNPQPDLGWLTKNPADLVIDADEAPNPGWTRTVNDCDNVLAGNFIWGDLVSAEMGMENMVASIDFRMDDDDPGWVVNTNSMIHRDGHFSGAIVFHPKVVNPYLLPDLFDSSPSFYLNPDWATHVGGPMSAGAARLGTLTAAGIGVVCTTAGTPNANRFNDTWSHPDVDLAYDKAAIWYNYFNESPFDAGEVYTTDVMLSFKTKYLNSVNCTFPFWNEKDEEDGLVYPSLADYYLDVKTARAGIACNGDDVCFEVSVWDMDENNPPDGPPVSSPGEWRYPLCLDDETNLMRFNSDPGAMTNPTLLYSPFEMGHFRIDNFYDYALRYLPALDVALGNLDPAVPAPFGICYFRHAFAGWVRSAMADFHYVFPGQRVTE